MQTNCNSISPGKEFIRFAFFGLNFSDKIIRCDKTTATGVNNLMSKNDYINYRLFERGFNLFGLIDLNRNMAGTPDNQKMVQTTKLFKNSIFRVL